MHAVVTNTHSHVPRFRGPWQDIVQYMYIAPYTGTGTVSAIHSHLVQVRCALDRHIFGLRFEHVVWFVGYRSTSVG